MDKGVPSTNPAGHEDQAEAITDGPTPIGTTSFIGRAGQISAASQLLNTTRLVTLVGAGGVGKTRLMTHLATELATAGAYPDGVIIVRLADVRANDDRLASTIAHRVGLLDNADAPGLARLIDYYQQHRHALLMLDNCEHLVSGVGSGPLPELLNTLLRAAKKLTVMATSRVHLGLEGERVLPIPPLRVSKVVRGSDVVNNEAHEALRLLIDRAAAVNIEIRQDEYPEAATLCRLLDGIPLAIELAAVQLDVVTLREMVNQDSELLRLLVDGPFEQRHHRNMHATIEWSYQLLEESEQLLFTLLSVFEGGFDANAAREIVAPFGIDQANVHRLLARLIRKSLLVAEQRNGRMRYRMLTIIRQFGQQLIAATEDGGEAIRQAHREYVCDLAARGRREWFGPDEPGWMDRISSELSDLRQVENDLLSDPASTEQGLELGINAAMTRALVFDGKLNEMRRMLGIALEIQPETPSRNQVAALSLMLWVAALQGNQALGDSLLDQVERVAERLDEAEGAVRHRCFDSFGPVLYSRGTRLFLNQPSPAEAREALELLERAEEALRAHAAPGDAYMAALFLAMARTFLATREEAVAETARVLAMARAADAQWCISWGLWTCALCELLYGEAGKAGELAQEALQIQLDIGDTWGPTWSIWLIALIAIKHGEYTTGAKLLGGAQVAQQLTQTNILGLLTFLRVQQRFEDAACAELGADDFDIQVAVGRAMANESTDEIFELARRPFRNPPPCVSNDVSGTLSGRELQVAELIAQKKSNHEIAQSLFISHRTVERHVYQINRKLGTRDRWEIARRYSRHAQQVGHGDQSPSSTGNDE